MCQYLECNRTKCPCLLKKQEYLGNMKTSCFMVRMSVLFEFYCLIYGSICRMLLLSIDIKFERSRMFYCFKHSVIYLNNLFQAPQHLLCFENMTQPLQHLPSTQRGIQGFIISTRNLTSHLSCMILYNYNNFYCILRS